MKKKFDITHELGKMIKSGFDVAKKTEVDLGFKKINKKLNEFEKLSGGVKALEKLLVKE